MFEHELETLRTQVQFCDAAIKSLEAIQKGLGLLGGDETASDHSRRRKYGKELILAGTCARHKDQLVFSDAKTGKVYRKLNVTRQQPEASKTLSPSRVLLGVIAARQPVMYGEIAYHLRERLGYSPERAKNSMAQLYRMVKLGRLKKVGGAFSLTARGKAVAAKAVV